MKALAVVTLVTAAFIAGACIGSAEGGSAYFGAFFVMAVGIGSSALIEAFH